MSYIYLVRFLGTAANTIVDISRVTRGPDTGSSRVTRPRAFKVEDVLYAHINYGNTMSSMIVYEIADDGDFTIHTDKFHNTLESFLCEHPEVML